MRSTQPIRLLPQRRCIIKLLDLQLVVQVLFLQLFYDLLKVPPITFYLPDLNLKVLYRLFELPLVREILSEFLCELLYAILLSLNDLLQLFDQEFVALLVLCYVFILYVCVREGLL